MKKLIMTAAAILIAASNADAKSLIAYYSRSGNTKAVAELIKTADGDADLFEIKTADPNHYPAEYQPMTEAAKAEINDGTYPAINDIPDLVQYDTVYVGTPCWWGTMAGPVHTFLTTADLSGKTVVPFNTHEGSGAGSVHTDIEKLTPNSSHKPGIAIRGSEAASASETINQWMGK